MVKKRVVDLKPHPLNGEIYTLSDIEDLAASIDQVGLLEPITIDKRNRVLSGHRRLTAIKTLGWSSVDCEVITIPKGQDDEYLVHFNKHRVKTSQELLNEARVLLPKVKIGQGSRNHQQKGMLTRDVLADELGVKSTTLYRLMYVDRHAPDLVKLIDDGVMTLNQAHMQVSRVINEKGARQERTPPKPKKRTRSSDSYRIYHTSSHDMHQLQDVSVDLIFTSPPYWNKRKYTESGGLGNEAKPTEYVTNLVKHFADSYRVLKDTGSFFLNIGDTFHQSDLQNIPHRVVIGLQDQGWILRNTIIWSKTNPKPGSSKSNLTPSYEFIFHLVETLDYKYAMTPVPLKENAKASLPPRHRASDGDVELKSAVSPYVPNFHKGKNMGDYWHHDVIRTAVATNRGGGIEHPAPFPEQIITLPILQTTYEGDVVLDPFGGSHTTGKVAQQLGRRYVGYDIKTYD